MNPDYKLTGNLVEAPENLEDQLEGPCVGNLIYDELGELVVRKINERFRGIRGLAFPREFQPNSPVTESNLPRSLAVNQILAEEGLDIHVPGLKEVLRYREFIPDLATSSSDMGTAVIYPSRLREDHRGKEIMDLVKPVRFSARFHCLYEAMKPVWDDFSLEVPYIVQGLGIKADHTKWSEFSFTKTERTTIEKAPYLVPEGSPEKGYFTEWLKYDSEKDQVVRSEQGIKIKTPKPGAFHSGLYTLSRIKDRHLINVDIMLHSDEGRVIQLVDNRS
jgi:hypothetical protein